MERPILTPWSYVIMFFAGMLGMLVFTFIRIRQIRKSYPNMKFREVWGTYAEQDWNVLMYSGLIIVVAMFLWDWFMETYQIFVTKGNAQATISLKWWVFTSIKVSFFFIGLVGQFLMDWIFGTAVKKIQGQSDDKLLDQFKKSQS